MFDRLLSALSIRRSLAGIYYELRTLRQLRELEHEALGYETLESRRASLRHRREGSALDDRSLDIAIDTHGDEEIRGQEAALEIQRKRNLGIDPGTDWRPDPNR